MKYLQKIGKALMLPVAVLPICGILMGIGYLLCPAAMQGNEIVGLSAQVGFYMIKAGGAVIDNMAILFAIGIATGMSEDNHGTACLAALVSWMVITTMISPEVIGGLMPGIMENEVNSIAFSKIQNPFIGILCGVIGAESYNRFKDIKLPDVLAFFSGRRFVAIVATISSLVVCLLLVFIWPVLFNLMVEAGREIIDMKGIGSGIYAFLNRLLIPSGLHHALNNVFWFDTIGIGDLTQYWSGSDGSGLDWSLGMYMSGFFPPMMFGIPGAALAMYHCAHNKKKARGILLSVSACAFLCGVTEPFEFLFMFISFPLYVVYAAMYGIITVITYYVGFRAGFAFSAGATDLLFSASLPAAAKTWMIIPLGLFSFAMFYVIFRFMITKFDIKTPGREDEDKVESNNEGLLSTGNKYTDMAAGILAAVGGRINVFSVDCCATRLRFELKDNSLVDVAAAKEAGAIGVVKVGSKAAQIIVGTTVQQVCDELKTLMLQDSDELRNPTFRDSAVEITPAIERRKLRHGERIQFGEPERREFSYVIRDKIGMHARPAGEFSRLMKEYDCSASVSANGKSATAGSAIELMGLGIVQGTEITISVEGKDAARASEAAERFFKERM